MATEPQLPSSTAVKDFLSTQGKDTSFTSIKNLFSSFGLADRLGSYVGSPNQNQTLLKSLQTTTSKSTPPFYPTPTGAPAPTTSTALSTVGVTPKAPVTQEAFKAALGAPIGMTKVPTPGEVPASTEGMTTNKALNTLGVTPTPPPTEVTPSYKGVNITGGTDAEIAAQVAKIDADTKAATGGTSASTIEPDADAGESNLINQWLNSAEGQNFITDANNKGLVESAKTAAAKQALETKYAADKSNLEEKLAANGLAFSGIRGAQVKALADSLASSLLGEDRELASKLLDADADLRDAILKGVADLAKQAQEGRKEAIQQLNAVGYAVIDGKLVPTLAARSAERADIQLQISERRLQLAEESANRAEARFQQLYGTGKGDQFNFVRQLMELNPNASEAELKAAAMENTTLTDSEINTILSTMPLAPKQMDSTARVLVATYFGGGDGLFTTKGGDLEEAKEVAKRAIDGGVIKVGNRTISLSPEDIASLKSIIDTVSVSDAEETMQLLNASK